MAIAGALFNSGQSDDLEEVMPIGEGQPNGSLSNQ